MSFNATATSYSHINFPFNKAIQSMVFNNDFCFKISVNYRQKHPDKKLTITPTTVISDKK